MIRLSCEACGGLELKKMGNAYKCAFCGSKYIFGADEKIIYNELTETEVIKLIAHSIQLHEENKFGEELEVLNKCLAMDENNASILVKLGRCYRLLNKIDKAIELYNRATEINPEEGAAYTNLGTIYILRQDYEKAAYCYERGLPLIDKTEFDYWIAYANYAIAVAKLGNPKKAEGMIKEAEARGYKNGVQIRAMAGMKSKNFLSGIKSLFS